MSIDNFIITCEARLSTLRAEISDIIKADGGAKIHAHMRRQLAEIEQLNRAIYKAQRNGLRE